MFDQAALPKRPALKSPITGLYLASAFSYGDGVEAVVMAGIICAHDIFSWKNPTLLICPKTDLQIPILSIA
jgi:hypothetical protein